MVDVIILDQFNSPSPYSLQKREEKGDPMLWTELEQRLANGEFAGSHGPVPRRVLVPETYNPEWCEMVYRATADGRVELWKCKVDSSG